MPTGLSLRLLLAGGAAVAVLGLAGGAVLKIKHDEAVKWRARVEAAQKQQKAEAVTTKALDTFTHEVTVIHDRADQRVQVVRQAAGADTPLPPDVLVAWRDGLRHEAPASDPGPSSRHAPR